MNVVEVLNQDLTNEYKHHRFYLHASFVIKGLPRLFLGSWLKGQADEELEHVSVFANKIVALGGNPTVGDLDFPTNLYDHKSILKYALEMEKEVVRNYVQRLKFLEEVDVKGEYYDLVLLYEEQIEDSQRDIDEIVKLLDDALLPF